MNKKLNINKNREVLMKAVQEVIDEQREIKYKQIQEDNAIMCSYVYNVNREIDGYKKDTYYGNLIVGLFSLVIGFVLGIITSNLP